MILKMVDANTTNLNVTRGCSSLGWRTRKPMMIEKHDIIFILHRLTNVCKSMNCRLSFTQNGLIWVVCVRKNTTQCINAEFAAKHSGTYTKVLDRWLLKMINNHGKLILSTNGQKIWMWIKSKKKKNTILTFVSTSIWKHG